MSDTKVTKDNLQEFAQKFFAKAKSIFFKSEEVSTVIPPIVTDWLSTNVDPSGAAGVVDKTLSIEGTAADAQAAGDAINDVNTALGDGRLYEEGQNTQSGYYKSFSVLKSGITYKLSIKANVSGTYDVQGSTSATSSGIVDNIATAISFVANEPVKILYTPSQDVYFIRLWACDNWTISAYDTETVWSAIEQIENETGELSNTINTIDTAFIKRLNKNRLNIDAITKNKRYNNNGVLVTEAGWDTSNAIPIEAGETLYFSVEENGVRHSANMWYIALFSGDTLIDYDNTGIPSYTAENAGTLYFTWRYSDTKTDLFCDDVSDANYYDSYGYSYIAKQTESYKPYDGIVWACVGDSMTATNEAAKKHYFDYISEELGFIIQNYGVSGTGYAAQMENNNAFYQRIASISEPFDVLTIFGSVNDISVDLPLGTYEDSGTSTIGGCINEAINSFYTVAPFKKIGIISQPPSVGTANNGHLIGTEAQAYNDLLSQICKNRGIPFLDLFNCSGLRPWNEAYRTEYYNEDGIQDIGVHPNSKGQKQISSKIREFIKTVI